MQLKKFMKTQNTFFEAIFRSRRWGPTDYDEMCLCGHAAYEDHSSADSREDDGPYGDRCHFPDNCTRSAFEASISRANRLVRTIARISRWWWTTCEYPWFTGIKDVLHNCGAVFGCRTCSTARHSYSTWYRRGQDWRGRRQDYILVFYELPDRPGFGHYRMRRLAPNSK
jgi:hypothetical protein